MIKIVKPTKVPKRLTQEGGIADLENRKKYDSNPKFYNDGGTPNLIVENKIYGHSSVKSILKKAQKNKCCFCEKCQKDENGAVEHFRPKGGYHSSKKESLKKPGYYWLGYEWDNLYFVCSTCNSKLYKGNLFPLEDESKRAKNHNDDLKNESPFLLRPDGDKDPRDHISFDFHLPKGKTIYGKKTIEICGIDRDALNDDRKILINNIEARIAILYQETHHTVQSVDEAKEFIEDSVKATAEFSSAAIDYLIPFKDFLLPFKIAII